MPSQPNARVALLNTAHAAANSGGGSPAHGSAAAGVKAASQITFLDVPGLDRPLPLVQAGSASLSTQQGTRLEGWLSSRPDHVRALLRGEDALEITDCGVGANNSALHLIPVLGEEGLQGVVYLVENGEHPAPELAGSGESWRLAASITRAIARIAGLCNRQDTQRHLIEELASENRELRELRDLLQGQIDAQMKLVSNAVHQLRNPLVAVRGYVRMTIDEELGPITAMQRECLATVMENSTRMAALLSDLSRSIAEQPLHCQAFDFVELWRESRDVFRSQIMRKSIEFAERLPEEDLTISGDRDKLALVLYKLLANTIKFTGPGGRVDACVSREQGFVSLSVRDTAEGIPPELVEKALGCSQPQSLGAVPECGAEKPPLSLVHEIVRLHGGEISVTSGMNEGWRVTLLLPVPTASSPLK